MNGKGLLSRHHTLLFGIPLALNPLDINFLVDNGLVGPATM